jgi:TolB-like protein/tRNA A-37 threonylcarbamoyl transferase component Bud32/thioredoxin-like negative regulator of GroEL
MAASLIGETAGHYRILERLGEGAMGEVYLAEDLLLRRHVALKMLRAECCDDETEGRLLREARAASALNHPGIAVVYEIGEAQHGEGKTLFIAMEYVAGETLGEAARRGDAPLERLLDWVRQAAEALGEAHARGIVHRDVKPSNLVVTPAGRVKVLDFGLALLDVLPGDLEATRSRGKAAQEDGALVGTLAYMSPEQALGEPVDGRADVFSLGAVLYELLHGGPAFPGKNAPQVLDAVLHQDPPRHVSRFADPRLPRAEELARRMLAKERGARPAGMDDVVAEIESIVRGEGGPPAAALAPSRAVAVMSFTNITRNGEDDWLGTGIAETVTADLRRVDGLTVIARERVHEALKRLAHGGDEEALAVRVGRELGARFVLNGGLQRAGDVVRLTARLTDVQTGAVAATVKIDGRMEEIFAVQDRIVRELETALRIAPKAPADTDETHVLEAYEAFSKGVINLRVESYENLDRAVAFFEKAARFDPSYARAHVELGSAYASKADYLAVPDLHDLALSSLRRALELSPGLVRAWKELAGVLLALGRLGEAEDAIRRALELDPQDAGSLATKARLFFIGRGEFREAASWFDRALARNPSGGWYALQLAHCGALLREFERGEEAARRAIALQEASLPGREGTVIVGSYMRLGHLAALQGRDEEAVAHFQKELAFLGRVDHALRGRIRIELEMRIGASLRRLGDSRGAAEALEKGRAAFEERLRLGADDPFTRYYAACVYALRGDVEEALVSLERAIRERRALNQARATIEPELERLRDDRRFKRLLQ